MDEWFKALVDRAQSILGTTAQSMFGVTRLYAVTYMNDDEIAALVTEAETDPVAFDFLRQWLAGDLPIPFPNPVPAPLVPFLQDLLGGRIPPPGNPKRSLPPELVRLCRDVLIEEFDCSKGMARDAIAKAAGLSSDRVKKLLRQKGG